MISQMISLVSHQRTKPDRFMRIYPRDMTPTRGTSRLQENISSLMDPILMAGVWLPRDVLHVYVSTKCLAILFAHARLFLIFNFNLFFINLLDLRLGLVVAYRHYTQSE